MAESSNIGLGIPPPKKPRLESTTSESSEVLNQLLNDLTDLPDLSSLDGLGSNDTGGLINATVPSQLSQQQNATPQSNSTAGAQLQPTPNHQGSSISPSATPPIPGQASSVPTPYSVTPPQTQNPTINNSTPNATINMYTNSPRGAEVPSPRYAGFNASGSPQPVAVTTLADPTPALPAVSSTPAHSNTSMTPSSSLQNVDSSMARTSFASPMMTSSAGAPSMLQQSNIRGGSPMPPGMRVGMSPGYQGGQGMHPGMHGMQVNHNIGGQMQHRGGMLGPMRVGMPTPPHAVHHNIPVDANQMVRQGMVTQTPMGHQGMHHPQMRTQQYHSYGGHGVHPVQQQQHRMMHNHMTHGMSHMGQVNPGMGATMRPSMSMNPTMAAGGQQSMGGMRVPNPGLVQNRPTGPVNTYNMNPGSQSQPQMDNRFGLTGKPDQQPQLQSQTAMTNTGMVQSPAQPSSQSMANVSQGGPGTQTIPGHQPTLNDTAFSGQQQQNSLLPGDGKTLGAPLSVGGSMTNTVSQPQQSRPQQQVAQSTALGSTGGAPSMPPNTSLQGINPTIDGSPLPPQQPNPQGAQQTPPSSVSSAQQSTAMNQPMSNRVPTPPPPGGSMGGLFPGSKPMQGGPPSQTSDPEKRKQIQQQLVLLLHAHKCQRRERDQQASGDFRACTLPHCKTMKSVLNHMTECQAGRTCTFAHCASSRQIITHWRNCVRPDCPVCLPLKHPSTQPQKQPTGQPNDGSGSQLMQHGATGPGQSSLVFNTPDIGQNPGMGMAQNPGMGPGGSMMNSMRTNMTPGHMMPGGSPGGMVDPNRAMFQANNVLGPGSYPNPNSVPGIGPSVPSSFPLPIPQIISNPTQQWHSMVNPDLRQHLVRKLVEAIYPVQDPTALRDARVKSLIQYAMKVEKVMFEAAHSREEYYKLLAQKIYLIRKELEDRKRNRNRGVGPMVNGGDPMHQMYPGGMGGQQQPGQPPSVQSNSGQYNLPPTPSSINALSSGTGNPSPRPNTDLPPGLPPTPILSIDTKKDVMNQSNKMMSPTSIGYQSNQNSNDPLSQIGLPGSVKTEIKSEPLLSPTYPPGSITGPPQSVQQQIKIEPNTGLDAGGGVNIAGVPPLPDNLPSVSSVRTPTASGVPSVKGPGSVKRRDSLSSDIKPSTPIVAMDTSTPRSPAVTNRIAPDPKLRKVFSKDELDSVLRPVFEAVWNQELESFPFRQPVNPGLLGIPDYFEVIKQPMDLTTISNKLSDGVYKNGWEFCSDMWLMFDNAWTYNKKTSRVYKYCSKLSEVFDQYIDAAMVQLGYCCGKRYTYHPQVLYCYGKALCTIPRDSPYYGCQNRYIYCPKCFNEIAGDTVTVGEDPLSATRIPKSQFKEMKNNAIDREPMIECIHCGRQMHQICVLHHDQIWVGGFQCNSCLASLGRRKKENKLVSKRLPVTKLGSYLEDRVNDILSHGNTGAGHVTIRVVSSSDKTLDTRPLMRERFAGDFPPQFPYKTKALFVFEEIDGVDVCFFGMHVQEYGSDCQAPNTRRVYISYLDSVHFFRPKQYRTQVYHEILIGYLDFCKANGFMTAHIWACPPSEGDDYIFHCHPLEQKIPKPKRLSDWYRKMLDTAKDQQVIYDYKDIFNHCTDEGITMVTEIPYFEGDFWPNVMEETIKELDQEAKEREASELASAECPKKAGKRGTNKKGKKASGARNKTTKKGSVIMGGDDLSSKVYQTMEKHKDVFFSVLLQPPHSGSSPLPGTTDPDQLITCDLMDGRDAFLTMSRERHWEFSSLRRAKFSSMSMVYELHTQSEDKFMYNCNSCHLDVVARYHCTECDDFDLCVKCYKDVGHNHPMIKLGLDIDDPQSNESKQLDPQKARKASIEKCIRALVHATQCRDPHCKQPSCIKMKKVLTHTRECKLMNLRKWNQCNICKQFVLLCISHAKNCTDDRCRVPLCATIKKNLKEQRKQRTVDTNRFTQMRAARMNSMVATNSAPSPPQNSSPANTGSHISPQSTGKNPAPAVPSPAAGPRSVGKGGPRTPGTPGKGRMVVNSPAPVGMGANPQSMLPQAGKPEQNMPAVPPNVTVTASPRMLGELEIKKVSTGYTVEQLIVSLRDPTRKEHAMQYLNANPAMKQQVMQQMRMGNNVPQDIMPYHPHAGTSTQMYNQHVRAPLNPGNMPMNYASNMGNYGPGQHPHQQAMMRYPANHPQYQMQHQVGQQRMAPTHRPAYQNMTNQQHPSTTLQRMLTSGTPQQQYTTQQPSYNPQMNPHHLGPPPQYPATAMRHPAPQTAGYPQVLGQQNRPMPAPSPMGSHMSPQVHAQYGGGVPAGQGMGMDQMAMQTADPASYMYQQQQQQQQQQSHQYALNSSNNNNSYSHGGGGGLSGLTPQDRLSKFVENL